MFVKFSFGQYPSGIDSNLNLWLKTNSVNLLKSTISSNEAYAYDWKFENDISKTFLAPYYYTSPVFHNNLEIFQLGMYEGIEFKTDSFHRYFYTSNKILNQGFLKI